MSDIFQVWQVQRDPSHYDTLSTVSNGQVYIEIGGDIMPEEQAQIAYLVKAAPEMLEVLQELDECAAYWSEYDVPIGIHDRIKAAIAKAEGRRS